MDLLQIVTLSITQGITEFLPVSSSAHLILVPVITGWPDQGLAFDVAVHVGTLSAVLYYFRRDLQVMAADWGSSLRGGALTSNARLAWAVLLATIPVGVAGLLFKEAIAQHLRSPLVIAGATVGFGALLWWSDVIGKRQRHESALTWKDATAIGLAQVLALIPGTSRSGITMTAGLAMGLRRRAAARFSFLLSIPVILLAGILATVDLVRQPGDTEWAALGIATVVSALSAYLCIHYFLRFLERVGMLPFVIYRFVLGGVLAAVYI